MYAENRIRQQWPQVVHWLLIFPQSSNHTTFNHLGNLFEVMIKSTVHICLKEFLATAITRLVFWGKSKDKHYYFHNMQIFFPVIITRMTTFTA